ncbi:MAG: flagellar basal body-associated FliL family protein [Gallionella sp.]|nr:flagellar basal body-associated FliL family protein [Gallionella sp.]
MAKGTKPGSKPEAQEAAAEAPPKKSKMKLIVIVIALVLLLAVGAVAALLLLKPAHSPEANNAEEHGQAEKVETPTGPPKFVDLGTFTTNLAPEEGDRFVQVVISLKISRPELEEQINASKPEILHRVNMMLQSKLPSELATVEGKARLADQIKVQIQHILGLRKTAPAIGSTETDTAPADPKTKGGLDEVLFTSFLMQ